MSSSSSSCRHRLRRRRRRRRFVFEIHHRRRVRRRRLRRLRCRRDIFFGAIVVVVVVASLRGGSMAARLEGPIWAVRKPPRLAPGLPGPKIVKFNKNFIKNTTQDLPPARIPESGGLASESGGPDKDPEGSHGRLGCA